MSSAELLELTGTNSSKCRLASADTGVESGRKGPPFRCGPSPSWTVIPAAVPEPARRRALFLSDAVRTARLAEAHLSEAGCDSLHGSATPGSLSVQEH